jgi:hypothetical protein
MTQISQWCSLLLYICFVCEKRKFPLLGFLPEVFCSQNIFIWCVCRNFVWDIEDT